MKQRRLNLGLVTFVAVTTDDQCIACPEQAAWLFEFNEKTRWWHQARFGLCLGCIEGADDDGPVAEPVGPVDYHGWVYFIRAGEFVKIGYSIEPAKRLGHLATASPLPLELWAKTRGNPVDERALHRRFARDRAHGEWFRVSDRIRNFVASIGGAALNAAHPREDSSPRSGENDSVHDRHSYGNDVGRHGYPVGGKCVRVDAAPPPNPAAEVVAQVGGLPGVLPQPPQTGTHTDRAGRVA